MLDLSHQRRVAAQAAVLWACPRGAQDRLLGKDVSCPEAPHEPRTLIAAMTMTIWPCAGFAEYGVNVNPSKTRLSFEMVTSSGTQLQVTWHRILQLSQRGWCMQSCLLYLTQTCDLYQQSHVHCCNQTSVTCAICIHSCMHSFIHSFIHSFVRSFVHSFVHSCICSFVHSFVRSFIHSFVRSFIHSF